MAIQCGHLWSQVYRTVPRQTTKLGSRSTIVMISHVAALCEQGLMESFHLCSYSANLCFARKKERKTFKNGAKCARLPRAEGKKRMSCFPLSMDIPELHRNYWFLCELLPASAPFIFSSSKISAIHTWPKSWSVVFYSSKIQVVVSPFNVLIHTLPETFCLFCFIFSWVMSTGDNKEQDTSGNHSQNIYKQIKASAETLFFTSWRIFSSILLSDHFFLDFALNSEFYPRPD